MTDMQTLRDDCWIKLPDGTTTTATEILKWREGVAPTECQKCKDNEDAAIEVIRERDEREEVIDRILDLVLGTDRREWSNLYGFVDAVHDVDDRMTELLAKGFTPPAGYTVVQIQDPAVFTEWLCREMPAGVQIGDPNFWAKRILRRFIPQAAAPKPEVKPWIAVLKSEAVPPNDESGKQPEQVFGIIDPDYARIFTQARIIAWQYGYACLAHGSFTRDLDLLLVPWADNVIAEPEHMINRLADAAGLRVKGPFTDKPHGRKTWTLLFTTFGDPRWVDISAVADQRPSRELDLQLSLEEASRSFDAIIEQRADLFALLRIIRGKHRCGGLVGLETADLERIDAALKTATEDMPCAGS